MSKKKKPAAQGKSGQPHAKPGAQKAYAPHSNTVVRRPPRHQGR